MTDASLGMDFVDILGVRFPRITREQAVQWLLSRIANRVPTAVCFPDMSTMNIAARDPQVLRMLQTRFITFNDGAGLAWASKRQGRPLPDNLNGTDLVPRLLASLPPGTRVFMIGTRQEVLKRGSAYVEHQFPHLELVGVHDGFFKPEEEARVVEWMAERRPQIVLVGMGNPLQIRFIDRYQDDPRFEDTTWLAVGGLLDYFGGNLVRAPRWMRGLSLEWAWIVARQPHKFRRYVQGIPEYLARCLVAELRRAHASPEGTLWLQG